MEFHEVANIFPLMDGTEYAELRDDIAANGLIEPIWTFDNKIIDGRNRYRACLDIGIQPEYRHYAGVETGLVSFVVSLNLKRRHLTASQRAVVGLDVERVLAEQARKRMLAGKAPDPVQRIEQGRAAKQAADIVGTNPQYIVDAKRIEEASHELLEKVRTGEMTIPQAKREVVRMQRQDAPALPSNKYRVIYADPPWKYGNDGIINNDNYGHVSRHYPSMSIEELCALSIRDLAESDAVLFLWVTSPLLAECFAVIKAWGFEYKTSFVWDKIKHNFGHYNSVRHELLLVCTRGSCTPDNLQLFDSVQSIERSDKHSEKPEEFRTIIDTLYTHGKKLELFARTEAEGWEVWGNEPTGD